MYEKSFNIFNNLHRLLIKASEEGYAIKMDWESVTEESLFSAIQQLINNPL